ncbi:MAG: RNase adapter RapZ, partial [Planctomycetota bacterium]
MSSGLRPASLGEEAPASDAAGRTLLVDEPASSAHGAKQLSLTLVSFGFKYGQPPANHYFDVSFLKNPARQEGWTLFSEPGEEMRRWVLEQPAAVEFLERM